MGKPYDEYCVKYFKSVEYFQFMRSFRNVALVQTKLALFDDYVCSGGLLPNPESGVYEAHANIFGRATMVVNTINSFMHN